jgi:hypothetical protein
MRQLTQRNIIGEVVVNIRFRHITENIRGDHLACESDKFHYFPRRIVLDDRIKQQGMDPPLMPGDVASKVHKQLLLRCKPYVFGLLPVVDDDLPEESSAERAIAALGNAVREKIGEALAQDLLYALVEPVPLHIDLEGQGRTSQRCLHIGDARMIGAAMLFEGCLQFRGNLLFRQGGDSCHNNWRLVHLKLRHYLLIYKISRLMIPPSCPGRSTLLLYLLAMIQSPVDQALRNREDALPVFRDGILHGNGLCIHHRTGN